MFYYIILSVIPSCRSACLISALCIITFCFFAPSLTITSDVVPTRMVLSGLPFKTHSSYRVSNPGSMLYFILSVSDNVLLFCVSPNAARLLFSPESRILRMRPNLVPPNGVERPKALNQFTVSFLFFQGTICRFQTTVCPNYACAFQRFALYSRAIFYYDGS